MAGEFLQRHRAEGRQFHEFNAQRLIHVVDQVLAEVKWRGGDPCLGALVICLGQFLDVRAKGRACLRNFLICLLNQIILIAFAQDAAHPVHDVRVRVVRLAAPEFSQLFSKRAFGAQQKRLLQKLVGATVVLCVKKVFKFLEKGLEIASAEVE
eukprot:SAG11_NODE_1925_length_4056_cov_3.841547_1_plen_153_part_00